MPKAVSTDLAFVQHGPCGCPTGIYKSVWDRLIQQVFGIIPPDMDADRILPNVRVWKIGVSRINETSFSVWDDGVTVPKRGDFIYYKGQYYIIGDVDAD